MSYTNIQVTHSSCSGFCRGTQLLRLQPRPASRAAGVLLIRAAKQEVSVQSRAPTERLRLNNLSPQPGARRPDKRKGRGYGGGQVSRQSELPLVMHDVGRCPRIRRGLRSRMGSCQRADIAGNLRKEKWLAVVGSISFQPLLPP